MAASAADRVFTISEQLEDIFIYVAAAEVESNSAASSSASAYIKLPFALQRVSKRFQATIISSSRLMKLRLQPSLDAPNSESVHWLCDIMECWKTTGPFRLAGGGFEYRLDLPKSIWLKCPKNMYDGALYARSLDAYLSTDQTNIPFAPAEDTKAIYKTGMVLKKTSAQKEQAAKCAPLRAATATFTPSWRTVPFTNKITDEKKPIRVVLTNRNYQGKKRVLDTWKLKPTTTLVVLSFPHWMRRRS